MTAVRAQVEERLRQVLADKRDEALEVSPESVELVAAIDDLTMRGGKRLRPIVVAAGLHAVGGQDDAVATDAGAALELLQSYLLIHDDWMDGDDERRGGKSVYAMMREAHDKRLGAALTVLAGDLAAAYASELFCAAEFPTGRSAAAVEVFFRLQREVFFGQQLDLLGTPDVERMYDLKTGSYTVRGPLRIGGLLGDAGDEALAALDRFARPLGIAFQLRDELLGTFGDPDTTGKPAGNDLRAGKVTTLISFARRELSETARAPVEDVLGRTDASDEQVAAAAEVLTTCGARNDAEERLAALSTMAVEALDGAPLRAERLLEVARLLTRRDH